MHPSMLTITKYSQFPNTSKKETNTQWICNWIKNTFGKEKRVYLCYTSKTTKCQMMPSDCFNLFPPGAWLWSSFIAVSGRSLCIFLLSTCLGRCGASAPEKLSDVPSQSMNKKEHSCIMMYNENFGTSTHLWFDAYYFLALCSLSFPSLHPFCHLRRLCTSTLRTCPFPAFALPNDRGWG